MFYDLYIKKTNTELIEILNSDSYQLLARETAQKVLDQRKVKYEINDEKPSLKGMNCFQLFDKLEQYGIKVYSSRRKKLIEINQDNSGLVRSIVLFVLSSISLAMILTIIFNIYSGTYFWSTGSRAYILRGLGIGTITFFIVGLMNYQKDKKSKVKILFAKNTIEIRQRKIWERQDFKFLLNKSEIEYKKINKRYRVFIPHKNRRIDLFDFKDNNVGNKTDDFVSILIEKLNKEMKTVGNKS